MHSHIDRIQINKHNLLFYFCDLACVSSKIENIIVNIDSFLLP